MMLKDRDIIIVGLQPWDIAIGSNCKNIATELAKFNRVLYINPPLDRKTYLKASKNEFVRKRVDVIKGRRKSLELVAPNIWNLYPKTIAESINWIGWQPLFSTLNKWNNKQLAEDILLAIDILGFKNYVLFNDQSMIRSFYLNDFLLPETFVYYIRDNLATIPYFQKHALKLEEKLIRKADVVATNSEFLAEYARKFNPRSEFVGQGCDFECYPNYKKITVNNELNNIPRPIIGYTGFLTGVRLDNHLLVQLANNNPSWSFVFVGPEDDTFKSSQLHQLKNVYFLGNKSPDDLPEYIAGFDVAINPQLVNLVTMGNYPRKIDEYLALSRPTVATNTPFMEYFKDHTYLADDVNQWQLAIDKALNEDNDSLRDERRNFALTHSWENNVNKISELIKKYKKFNENYLEYEQK